MVLLSSFRCFKLMHLCLHFSNPSPPKFSWYDLRRDAQSPAPIPPQLLPCTLRPSSVGDDGAEVFLRVGTGVQLQQRSVPTARVILSPPLLHVTQTQHTQNPRRISPSPTSGKLSSSSSPKWRISVQNAKKSNPDSNRPSERNVPPRSTVSPTSS